MSITARLTAVLTCLCLAACSAGKSSINSPSAPAPQQSSPVASLPAPANWPSALPTDGVQPWETTDASGHVLPSWRLTSSVNGNSTFSAGTDTFTTGGTVTPAGEALHASSGAAGSKQLAFATYRLPLAGAQPGVVALDVNLDSAGSKYWVGLADFAVSKWQWHGPFSDNHIRLVKAPGQLDSSNYVSPLGNLFVAVAAYDGSAIDVVGVGTNPTTDGDAALPPAPAALGLTPQNGGLLLEWTPSAAGDLAGYRILWSNREFAAAGDSGVQSYDYADGGGRLFLPLAPRLTFVAVEAVDIAGHASPLTAVQNAVPLAGTPPALNVSTSAASGLHDTAITLTATGAASYDFDLDGDGVYDVTGDTTGTAQVDTSKPGIIRPGVRGHGAGGQAVALGGVSLIITGNTRPVVTAAATPQTGAMPLQVNLSASAQDAEDAPAALTYAWDFDGDGIFEAGTNQASLQHIYTYSGAPPLNAQVYNATVRVTDAQGSWGACTLSILAYPPANQAPVAVATVNTSQLILPMRLNYLFDGFGSTDVEDVTPAHYDWDFNSDGIWDILDGPGVVVRQFTSVGTYTAALRVRDSGGLASIAHETYYVPSICSNFHGTPDSANRLMPGDGPLTNNVRWTLTTGNWVESPPAIGPDATIYVTSNDGKVYALTDNGTPTPAIKWSYNTGNGFVWNAAPVIGADGTVYVANSLGKVFALVDNGTTTALVKWTYVTGGSIYTAPALGPDGTLYVASLDTKLYALMGNGTPTPTVKWSFTANSVYSSPTLGPDGTVYIGSGDNNVYALVDNGTTTPTVKWSYLTGGAVVSSPAIGPDGTVYAGSVDKKMYALTDNGTAVPTLKWSYLTGGQVYSGAAVAADGTVCFGSYDGKVYAVIDNGTASPTVKWTYTTGALIFGTPVLGANGTVYIGGEDSKVYALVDNGTATPTVQWSFLAGAGIYTSPTLGPNGLLYCGSDDFKLYCFGQ